MESDPLYIPFQLPKIKIDPIIPRPIIELPKIDPVIFPKREEPEPFIRFDPCTNMWRYTDDGCHFFGYWP